MLGCRTNPDKKISGYKSNTQFSIYSCIGLQFKISLCKIYIRATISQLPVRYIRQVTVVTGKGFYTYCSGPPAPFLRVEYYDPKSKWKIKLVLERGLDVDEACKWSSSSLSLSLGLYIYIYIYIISSHQYLLCCNIFCTIF